jgi:hypothetical protein
MLLLRLIYSFLFGVLFGNGIPHFARGMTGEKYPSLLGSSPVANVIEGWICWMLATWIATWARLWPPTLDVWAAAGIGLLLIGLFHALGFAPGRRD